MWFTRGCSRGGDSQSSELILHDDDGGVGLAADGVGGGDGQVVGAFRGVRQGFALLRRVGIHRPVTVVPRVQGASACQRQHNLYVPSVCLPANVNTNYMSQVSAWLPTSTQSI